MNAYYKASSHVSLQGGYAIFLAGTYLERTGPHDNAHFAYTQVTLNF